MASGDAGTNASTDPFAPPGQEWTRVSPRLAQLRRTLLLVVGVPATLVVAAAVALLEPVIAVVPLVLGGVLLAWVWYIIGRNARSWGYAERADDLLVRSGVLFRKLVVVPYGRMQLVDVTAGPLDRRYGIARVQLHTAAATSDAVIPGLVPPEASRLRERLSALGEAKSAGL
jgi:membrane protein YdbS with pleckstrin-like domain